MRKFVVTERSLAARDLALALMAQHDLGGWQFAFDGAKKRLGACHYPRHGRSGRISLSVHFTELNDLDRVRNTLLHEIAHALVGPGHGHDAVWLAKCLEIGGDPSPKGEGNMPAGAWQACCTECGRKFHRARRPGELTGWYCRHCGPDKGGVRWERTPASG